MPHDPLESFKADVIAKAETVADAPDGDTESISALVRAVMALRHQRWAVRAYGATTPGPNLPK
jgi:hypothetical protein